MISNNARLIGINWWKGYQLIVIDEVAAEIPPTFLSEVLYRCSESRVSLELCVFSGEDQNLHVAFIVRCEDSSRYSVSGRLDDLVNSLLPQFEEAGFSVHTAAPNDPVVLHINRVFGGDLAPCCVSRGFFPEDKLIGPRRYYIPGQYTRGNCDPIHWDRISSIITRHPMSMMCLQLIHTSLSPLEIQFLQNSRHYLSTLQGNYEAAQACAAYEQVLRLQGQSLYFVNMFCVGSDLFTSDMTALMRTWKYRTFIMPPQTLQEKEHLFLGDVRFKSETTEFGHMADCHKAVLAFQHNQFRRLSHLVPVSSVLESFPLPFSPGNIPNLRVKARMIKPVLIPPEAQYRDTEQMIYLGTQEQGGARVGIHLGELRRHGFIVGKSGCGKTTFAMGLLHQLNQKGIPFLVVEPTKCEYRALRSVIPDLRVYTPGASAAAPIQLNPFMPPRGITLEEYLPALSSVFNAAISMDHPLDVILPQVIRICYNRYGWRDTSTRDSKGATPFGMTEFAKCYQDYIRQAYADDPKARANLESGGLVRLMQLTAEHPILFDTINMLDFDDILAHPTVIELDAISNEQQCSLIMMTILAQAQLCIRKRTAMDSPLQSLIMIDEAHLLLGGNNTSTLPGTVNSVSACIHYLQDMVKILRSYGTGIFFGDQSPEKLTRDIMEHVNLKIMFQQDSMQSRTLLAGMTRMDYAMQEDMITLAPGHGFVFFDSALEKPIKLHTPNYKQTLALRNDVSDIEIARMMNLRLEAPFPECSACTACSGQCTIALRSDARFIAERIFTSPAMNNILQESEQSVHMSAFAKASFDQELQHSVLEQGLNWPNMQMLRSCTAIHLLRKLLLSSRCLLSQQELMKSFFPDNKQISQPESRHAKLGIQIPHSQVSLELPQDESDPTGVS